MIATLSQNWWVLAVRGIAAILFGIGTFLWPGMTLTALVLLFGAYATVDGVFAVSTGIATRKERERWWMMILAGLASLMSGVLTLLWPGITALVLLYLIATWAIVTGIFQVAAAIRLRKEIENEWGLAWAGIGSLIFGILLMIIPGTGALALVWIIGSYALLYGILLLVSSFRLRGLRNVVTNRLAGTA